MDPDPPTVRIYDREDPSPFETMFLIVAVIGGGAILVGGDKVSGALTSILPTYVTTIFCAGLGIGGVTALVGQLVLTTLDGSLVEAAGLSLLSFLLAAYAGYAMAYASWHGLVAVLFLLGFVGASIWRILRIRRRIHRLRKAMTDKTAELRQLGGDSS